MSGRPQRSRRRRSRSRGRRRNRRIEDDDSQEDLTTDVSIQIQESYSTVKASNLGLTEQQSMSNEEDEDRRFHDIEEEEDTEEEEEQNWVSPGTVDSKQPRKLSSKDRRRRTHTILLLLLVLFLGSAILSAVFLRARKKELLATSAEALIGDGGNESRFDEIDSPSITGNEPATGTPTEADNVFLSPGITSPKSDADEILPPSEILLSPSFQCVDAPLIKNGMRSFGSTSNARTIDQQDVQPPVCNPQVPMNGAGVWYTLTGDGNVWTVDTCSGTNFDTQISVYEGMTCDNLACTTSNDQFCGDQSSVTWYAKKEMQYFIYVHGYRSEVGDFSLTARVVDQENTSCETGQFVELSMSDSLLELAGSTQDVPASSASSDMPGMWYRILGWGSTVTVTTCSDRTNYPTNLQIFTSSNHGNCELLSVVQTREENCPNGHGSIVSFDTVSREIYHIKVQGGSAGN